MAAGVGFSPAVGLMSTLVWNILRKNRRLTRSVIIQTQRWRWSCSRWHKAFKLPVKQKKADEQVKDWDKDGYSFLAFHLKRQLLKGAVQPQIHIQSSSPSWRCEVVHKTFLLFHCEAPETFCGRRDFTGLQIVRRRRWPGHQLCEGGSSADPVANILMCYLPKIYSQDHQGQKC